MIKSSPCIHISLLLYICYIYSNYWQGLSSVQVSIEYHGPPIRNANYNIRIANYNICNARYNIRNASYNIGNASYNIHNAKYNIRNDNYNIVSQVF